MPTDLYVYIGPHNDLKGAIGTLTHKEGWVNKHFQTFNEVIMVRDDDVRPLTWKDRVNV